MPQTSESQKRRIKKAKIKFISLCPRGANRLKTLYKEDGSFEIETLVKANMELGEITSIVYSPEFRDSQGDIASAQVIKDMAYEFSKAGGQIDIRHDGKDVGRDRAYVAESFIVQKGDPRFSDISDYQGNHVDVTEAWATVIKLEDPALRSLYTDHGWQGISMAGSAEVEIEREDVTRSVADQLSNHYQTEADMALNDTDLEKIAGMISGALADALKKEEPAEAAPKTPASTTPAFEGDPLNKEDVEAHRDALRKHALQEKLSKATTAAEVDEILKELEGAPAPDEETTDNDEVSRLKKELAKAQAASAAPVNASSTPTDSDTQAALVKSMAAYANGR